MNRSRSRALPRGPLTLMTTTILAGFGAAACAASPVEEAPRLDPVSVLRPDLYRAGSIGVKPAAPRVAITPTNATPPTGFALASVPGPDGSQSFTNVLSSNQIAMEWDNTDTTSGAFSTIYRQVTDIYGNCTPGCGGSFSQLGTLSGLPAGNASWTDNNAVPNALNCYYVADTDSAGLVANSTSQCAYTRDGNNIKPARYQLELSVGPAPSNTTADPVFVTLQGSSLPAGNLSWLMKDTAILKPNSTTSFDLYTTKSVYDLSDITQIGVGVAGTDDLCITTMRLVINDDGSSNPGYRIAFYKDFTGLPGGCATAVGSDGSGPMIQVGFDELRQSPDYNFQINQELNFRASSHPSFGGYYDAAATRGMLMGLIQNSLHAKGIQMRTDSPIELSVGGNDVRSNNILHVVMHIHKDCDVRAAFDIRLINQCDCVNGANAITDTQLVVENGSADLEGINAGTIGDGVLTAITGLFTLGQWDFADWLRAHLSGEVMSALAGHDQGLANAPLPTTQYGFQTQETTYGGFGFVSGQVCDTANPSCSCASTSPHGYCEPD